MPWSSHLVSMERRVPVQHFFDGFRTSHEVNKVKLIDYDTMKSFINWDAVKEHHDLAMNPRHPHVQGTSQGPDIFFQCVEAGNSFYDGLADLFEDEGQDDCKRKQVCTLHCMPMRATQKLNM